MSGNAGGVQFTTNAGSLAVRQRERAAAASAGMLAALAAWGQAVKAQAVQRSQGAVSAAQRRRSRPGLYSARLPASPASDAIVNRQGGEFAAGWRTGVWSTAGGVTVTVWNQSPPARYMAGTDRMRPRPVLTASAAAVPPPALAVQAGKRAAEGRGLAGSRSSLAGAFALDVFATALGIGAAYAGALSD